MKRVYIAAAVLCACLAFSVFSYFTIIGCCKTLIDKTQKVTRYCSKNELEEALKESEEIKQLWDKYTLPFSLLTTHYHYDAIEQSVDKLYRETQSKDKDKIKESASQLIFEAKHIITSTEPKGENVF